MTLFRLVVEVEADDENEARLKLVDDLTMAIYHEWDSLDEIRVVSFEAHEAPQSVR